GSPPQAPGRRPAEPPSRRVADPSPQPGTSAPEPATAADVRAEFTLEALQRAWPDVVLVARAQGRFLGEALAAARPVSADPPLVGLSVADGNPMHLEALERQRDAVQALL